MIAGEVPSSMLSIGSGNPAARRFAGKDCLVTGAASGIGRAIALRLAAEGGRVAVVDIDIDGARETLSLCEGTGAFAAAVDVRSGTSVETLAIEVKNHFGGLDVLVNNAGVAPKVRADLLEAGEESFERLIRTNVQGPYFLTQAVARWMIEQKRQDAARRCAIITISSVSAEVVSVNRGDYCVSKAALAMATQLFAARLGAEGIGVYEIRPGIIATDMTAGVKDKYDKLIEGGLLVQPRWGEPGDIGKAVAMLARGDLPYSPGQVLYVDGGLNLRRL